MITPEQQAALDARAVVPAGEANYALNLPDSVKQYLPQGDKDPAVAAIMAGFKEAGLSQGAFDDTMRALQVMQEKGVLAPPFDAAAQTQALGENGAQRQGDLSTFADALLQRKEIDAEEHAELQSLIPTAAGVRLLEKLKGWMSGSGNGPNLSAAAPAANASGKSDAQLAADAARRDPKYGKDTLFTQDADKKFMAAYRGGSQ